MKNTIKIAIFLAIVACLSGLSISLVNNFTSPIIEKSGIASEKENLKKIFPDSEFTSISYNDSEGIILGAYKASKDGYVFKATGQGFNTSTPIVVLIGMDQKGTITNIIALEHNETNGVGSKCFEDANINKMYIGKKINEDVDTLAGATFTSSALKLMINKAQIAFSEVK